jgi:hypothetical protein
VGWTEYSTNNGSGTRGTITFEEEGLVAAFRDERCDRLFLVSADPSACELFAGAPMATTRLAGAEALQYLLDDVSGVAVPVISAAFWSEGDQISASLPWDRVVANGAQVLERQFLPEIKQWTAWQEYYDLVPQEIDLAQRLFAQRTGTHGEALVISEADMGLLRQLSISNSGLVEALTSAREMGFTAL